MMLAFFQIRRITDSIWFALVFLISMWTSGLQDSSWTAIPEEVGWPPGL